MDNRGGARPLVRCGCVIKWRELSFDHLVEIILSDFLLRRIFLQWFSWLLSPSSCLQWGFLQEKFFEIIGSIKVSLLGRWNENWLNLLSLERLKIYRPEKGIVGEAVETGRSHPLGWIFLKRGTDGVETRH